ncbi:unnamed protein product [Rotaria sp. Silwood2]|nr:unnamed protein product [Rotaria sp. Silwood2]
MFLSFSLSTLSITRLLIQCGADVNQICDRQRNRPLYLIAKCSNIAIASPIIELLFASGAHLDTNNLMNRLPQDIARTSDIRKLLCRSQKLSFKCRCAQIIASSKFYY